MPGITAIPVLRVADFNAAVPYYRDVLGFTVGFQYDGYVSLQLDQAVLHLSGPKPGKPAGGGTVYLIRDEVDGYFGSIRARGATPDNGSRLNCFPLAEERCSVVRREARPEGADDNGAL